MFNSGLRGKRAPDNFGTVSSQTQFVQQESPRPNITSWSIVGTDDAALNPAGGQTVLINGSGFAPGAAVTVNGQTISPVTVINSTQISFTSIALPGGSYSLIVYNSTGNAAILVPGLIYSAIPSWTTPAGSIGNLFETQNINTSVVATSDSPITYTLTNGSLPIGATFYANGVITGVSPIETGSTTYTFSVRAEDAEKQDVTRTFTLTINTDVVSWNSPENNTTYTVLQNEAISNIALSASSAAGSQITYSANTLPSGISISGANIVGTPTTIANTSSLLTATATATARTATRTINWVVMLGTDLFFNRTTMLVNGEISTNYWIQDVSANGFAITPAGDARPISFSPFSTSWSNFFAGSGSHIAAPASSALTLTGDFTIEFWAYPTASYANQAIAGSTITSLRFDSGGFFYLLNSFSQYVVTSTASFFPLNQWTHTAIVRSGTTFYFFRNGISLTISEATGGAETATFNLSSLNIGRSPHANGGSFTGYISNFRVVKGTAVYTAGFTPPTLALTAITNTSILTCQSGNFRDNSVNNFTMTPVGTCSTSSFSPVAETQLIAGSGYFDGIGDYLTIDSIVPMNFGTNNFTIECWIWTTVFSISAGASRTIIGNSGTNYNMQLYINTSNGGLVFGNTIGAFSISSINTVADGVWHHVAIVRGGTGSGQTALFVDGVRQNTGTNSLNYSSNTIYVGSFDGPGGNGYWNGYISNLRIVSGTDMYGFNNTTITVPASPLTVVSNTSLLTLQTRFGENNTRFVDSSNSNNIITRNGNASQGSFSPFSQTGWSVYLDGNGDGLSVPSNAALTLSNADFTIEFWVNAPSQTNTMFLDLRGGNDSGYPHVTTGTSTAVLRWGPTNTQGTTIICDNLWHHCAITRQSGTLRLFVDGVLNATVTDNNNYSVAYNLAIGYNSFGGGNFTGYLSNYRIIKGTSLYNSNFTPSNLPLLPVTNTSLITFQDNRIVDGSANNFTITRIGDVSVQSFSPFAPAIVTPVSYSAFFDGNSDNLTVSSPSSSLTQWWNTDFTIECWIYPTTLTNTSYSQAGNQTPTLVGNYSLSDDGNFWSFGPLNNGTVRLYYYNGSSVFPATSTQTVTANQWNHIALTNVAGTGFRYWVNGIGSSNIAIVGTPQSSSSLPIAVGWKFFSGGSAGFTGYISNLRIVKGTAIYGSNFTPPVSPLSAVTNTSLLTCQSNTLVDNSNNKFSINALGNVRASQFNPFNSNAVTGTNASWTSTVVGGSMYFDGTGDFLSIPHSSLLTYGTSNFTIEFWIYVNAYGNPSRIFEKGTGGGGYSMDMSNTGILSYNNNTTLAGSQTTVAVPLRSWTHVALVRSGTGSNQTMWYINGTLSGTWTYSVNVNENSSLFIGGSSGSLSLNAYLSNLRFVIGTVLYSSSFSPPVAPLDPIANTVLLLNGSNCGIIDYTSKNNLETVGNIRIRNDIKKYGAGSIFFDGNSSLVSINSTTLSFGTADFTVEFWIYPLAGGTVRYVCGSVGATDNFLVYLFNGTELSVLINGSVINPSASVTLNAWSHVAVTRANAVVRIFLNGNQIGSGTNSGSITATRVTIGNGVQFTGPFNGYMDDLRITQGTARYTSNFTPPTSAFITF